jgi:hypothetical protein
MLTRVVYFILVACFGCCSIEAEGKQIVLAAPAGLLCWPLSSHPLCNPLSSARLQTSSCLVGIYDRFIPSFIILVSGCVHLLHGAFILYSRALLAVPNTLLQPGLANAKSNS